MLRLLKFKARFGFTIEESTKKALLQSREEITKSSPARVLEELLRMLESGSSAPFFHLLAQAKILPLLFPSLTQFLEGEEGNRVYSFLQIADQMNQNPSKRTLKRPLLLSCLLFPIVQKQIEVLMEKKEAPPHLGEILLETSSVIKEFVTSSFSHLPKRISATASYIMSTQYRLTPIQGRCYYRHKLLAGKEFPLALQFLKNARSD